MCGMYTEADLFKGFSLPLDFTTEAEETTLSCWGVYCKRKSEFSAVCVRPFVGDHRKVQMCKEADVDTLSQSASLQKLKIFVSRVGHTLIWHAR